MTQNSLPSESPSRSRAKLLWRPVILFATLAALMALAYVLDLGQYIGAFKQWINSLGVFGPLVFILLYAVLVVAAVPGSALTVAAGAIFGSIHGTVIVSVASTVGASLAFLVSRYFARDAVAEWLGQRKAFQKLNEMTEKKGATIVALTRLVPIFPFNLLNYGFGLTRVHFWTYVFWTWLCMLPITVVIVIGADTVTTAITQGRVPRSLLVALAVAVLILTLLIRTARKRLRSQDISSK